MFRSLGTRLRPTGTGTGPLPRSSREPRARRPARLLRRHPLTPFTRRRLAAGVMRGVRNGPSFFRPITALRRPCRRNRAKEVTAFSLISSVPSLRRVTSFPVTSVRYALRSLRSLSFFACHVIPALRPRGPEPGRNRRWSGRNGSEVEVSEPRTGINLSCHSLSLRFVSTVPSHL